MAKIFLLVVGLLTNTFAYAGYVQPEPVVRSLPCLLSWVEGEMFESPKPSVDRPAVFLAHTVSLRQFQDDIEPQWHQRPNVITNAFVAHSNHIYLTSDKEYYDRNQRSIYDSLVHELVHFIQIKYRHFPVDQLGDAEEMIAVEIQARFREAHPELLKEDYKCSPP